MTQGMLYDALRLRGSTRGRGDGHRTALIITKTCYGQLINLIGHSFAPGTLKSSITIWLKGSHMTDNERGVQDHHSRIIATLSHLRVMWI